MLDPAALRIIDVNLNRAREAFRVIEDFARFALDDAGLTAAVKETRHALVGAMPPGFDENLIAWREILGDVGKDLTAALEYDRPTSADVAVAACKRLGEALRTVEEYAKVADAAFAESVEQIRYRGYELERRLRFHLRAHANFGEARLYVLLTESKCRGNWFETAEAALRGGADGLQLREKAISDRELLRRGKRLADLCRAHGAFLIVNDRSDIARLVGAHGVHLGQDDVPVAEARRILSTAALIGISTHTRAQAVDAAAASPDYIAVGPIFPSALKPEIPVAGVETLAAVRACTSLPLVAIGGIDESNARAVLTAAPCCLCVCTAIIAQDDVQGATQRLRAVIQSAHPSAGVRG